MSPVPPSPQSKQIYRLRVLIADDAREARRGTRLMLAMHPGVEVVAIAQNGQQALELAQLHQPDIAIMDVNMPEMDGISAIRAMRLVLPHTVYIIISGEKDPETHTAAREAGVQEFLIKPFTYEDLDLALRRSARAWMANRQRANAPFQSAFQADTVTLKRLAGEYSQARRTDDAALAVYEKLAARPGCELRWLVTLAMVYVIRQDWGKLKRLAAYLESRKSQ